MDEDLESYDDLDKLLASIQDARNDIAASEALFFEEKWKSDTVLVPATLVDWSLILSYLMKETEYENYLGDWKTKLSSSEELRESLGVVSHLEEPFIEYINGSRRSNIKQNIALFVKLGCIDLVMDDNGKETYIMLEYPYDGKNLHGFVEETIKAYEIFR